MENQKKSIRRGRTPENRRIAFERRKEIARRMKLLGPLSLNRSALAKEFGVTDRVIMNDFKIILSKWDPVKVETLKVDLEVGFLRALSEAKKLLFRQVEGGESKADADRLRLAAARTYAQLSRDITEFLERFGMKERPSDRLHIGVVEGDPVDHLVRELLKPVLKRGGDSDGDESGGG